MVLSAPQVIGLLGAAVLGYLVGRRQEKAKAAELRQVVATALLAEIQSLEIALRRLAVHRQAARSTLRPEMATFEAFRPQLVLLTPETAQTLIVFYGLVQEINSSRRGMTDAEVELTDDAHRFVRAKAAFAANRLPELRRLLEAAGGRALPTGESTWVSGGTEVELGEPAFEATTQLPAAPRAP